MSDLTSAIDYDLPVVSTVGFTSVGRTATAIIGATSVSGGTAWPSANLAIFFPFYNTVETTLVKMFWLNGGTVGTNGVDVGIYDSQGNRLVSGGGVTTSGATTEQIVDITDTTLLPGFYYLAMAMNGVTDTLTVMSNITAPTASALGIKEMATAYPLPSTATFTDSARTFLPYLQATRNTLI